MKRDGWEIVGKAVFIGYEGDMQTYLIGVDDEAAADEIVKRLNDERGQDEGSAEVYTQAIYRMPPIDDDLLDDVAVVFEDEAGIYFRSAEQARAYRAEIAEDDGHLVEVTGAIVVKGQLSLKETS